MPRFAMGIDVERCTGCHACTTTTLVTFDVRLSNTAGRSDEWHAPFPGTEGAIALARCHAIVAANDFDKDFVSRWTNVTIDELRDFLKPYTPAWAEKLSGIRAADIERLALEFIRARPRCAAFTNRGSHAHYNGFNNDRAVILLNALAGRPRLRSQAAAGGQRPDAQPLVGRGRRRLREWVQYQCDLADRAFAGDGDAVVV